MSDTRPAECEFCHELATWEVTGQWTIADWLEVYACGGHLVDAHRWLALRTVDGVPCRERCTQWIGPDYEQPPPTRT